MSTLKERAVLMRISLGLPGEQRQDRELTEDVKREKELGTRSGKWEKFLYPPEALKSIKKKQTEARDYHNSVTLPFDNGVGILPAALIKEYGDRMRQFKGEIENLVEVDFLSHPEQWIQWARKEHNGTFNPDNYPGCKEAEPVVAAAAGDNIAFDAEQFRKAMRPKFYFRNEPLPVPDSCHFANTVASLLGTDLESVDLRVRDAAAEAQKELFKRILAPVKHMADTLSKDKPRIFDTLIGNIREICKIAPALNLADDPELNKLVKDCEILTRYNPDDLRENETMRTEARKAAEAMVAKLSGYKL